MSDKRGCKLGSHRIFSTQAVDMVKKLQLHCGSATSVSDKFDMEKKAMTTMLLMVKRQPFCRLAYESDRRLGGKPCHPPRHLPISPLHSSQSWLMTLISHSTPPVVKSSFLQQSSHSPLSLLLSRHVDVQPITDSPERLSLVVSVVEAVQSPCVSRRYLEKGTGLRSGFLINPCSAVQLISRRAPTVLIACDVGTVQSSRGLV